MRVRDAWRARVLLAAPCCALAVGAVHLACEADCAESVPIEDGAYVGDADDEMFGGAALEVDGDVITIEYSDQGVTYLVELRRMPPP